MQAASWIIIIIALIAILVAGYSAFETMRLRRRFRAALGGVDGENIEATLASHLKQVRTVDKRLGELAEAYKQIAAASGLASQKISIVRFNPFADTGGDQSFVLAVLDSHNSGYVLTSIHGRQGTRVYVKPIDYGKSKYTLSREEQQALDQAASRVPEVKE